MINLINFDEKNVFSLFSTNHKDIEIFYCMLPLFFWKGSQKIIRNYATLREIETLAQITRTTFGVSLEKSKSLGKLVVTDYKNTACATHAKGFFDESLKKNIKTIFVSDKDLELNLGPQMMSFFSNKITNRNLTINEIDSLDKNNLCSFAGIFALKSQNPLMYSKLMIEFEKIDKLVVLSIKNKHEAYQYALDKILISEYPNIFKI